MVHRLGTIYPGETAVLVGVSSVHRKEAFEACAWLMDQLKQQVPIWKKEFTEDGAVWVAAHP
jgi:molybdopterin synthase catalytic subunit